MPRAEPLERHVERDARAAAKRFEHPPRHGKLQIGPQFEHAFGQRQLGITQEHRGIRADLHTETFARLAPAERAVERKAVRRQWLKAAAALAASQMLAVNDRLPLRLRNIFLRASDMHDALAQSECVLDRAGNARAIFSLRHDAVDDNLDLVLA